MQRNATECNGMQHDNTHHIRQHKTTHIRHSPQRKSLPIVERNQLLQCLQLLIAPHLFVRTRLSMPKTREKTDENNAPPQPPPPARAQNSHPRKHTPEIKHCFLAVILPRAEGYLGLLLPDQKERNKSTTPRTLPWHSPGSQPPSASQALAPGSSIYQISTRAFMAHSTLSTGGFIARSILSAGDFIAGSILSSGSSSAPEVF
eukprot:1576399-Rhodomonas_salina.1